MPTSATVKDLAAFLGAPFKGEGGRIISGVRGLEMAGPADISFLANPRYLKAARTSSAGCLLAADETLAETQTVILVPNPQFAFAKVLALFHPPEAEAPGIHPLACVHPQAAVGKGVSIGAFSVIEEGAVLAEGVRVGAGGFVGRRTRVGARTVLSPRVTLYHDVTIGADCILHSGVVIGADGFGFVLEDGNHHKIPQVGGVEIGDDVEIGANSTVDRGTMEPTVIGNNVKIDNLVQIAHNCRIGDHSILCAQVGLSGSTTLGQYVILTGQAGTAGHLTVGDGVIAGARAGIAKDVAPFQKIAGTPALDHNAWKREVGATHQLPETLRTIRELRRRIVALEKTIGGEGLKGEVGEIWSQ